MGPSVPISIRKQSRYRNFALENSLEITKKEKFCCCGMCVQRHNPESLRLLRREGPRKRSTGGRQGVGETSLETNRATFSDIQQGCWGIIYDLDFSIFWVGAYISNFLFFKYCEMGQNRRFSISRQEKEKGRTKRKLVLATIKNRFGGFWECTYSTFF